jgi:hypothetical protein
LSDLFLYAFPFNVKLVQIISGIQFFISGKRNRTLLIKPEF